MNNELKRNNNDSFSIDIRTFFTVLWDNIWVIVGAAALAIAAVFVYTTVTYVPMYSSTATLYILKNSDDASASSSDFSLALNVVNDCKYSLKSTEVLNSVLIDLNLQGKYTARGLSNNITITNPASTRFLEVTINALSPDEAKAIVDEICDVSKAKMEKVMGFNQVNIFKYGNTPSAPSNKTSIKTYAIAGIAAAAVVYLVFLLIHILNDTIETDDEFKDRVGLIVLATIPDVSAVEKRKHYGRYGGKYGGKYGSGYGANNQPADGEVKK